MLRAFHAFLLAFLLLGFQQREVVHAFEHLGTRHGPSATLAHPGVACATCELLAAGADGVPATAFTAPVAGGDAAPASLDFVSRAVAAPAAYSSRAPPPLS